MRWHISSLIGCAILVYLSVILVQTIRRNYQLRRQISDLETQIDQLTVQKDELEYQIQYYATDAFKEKEARAKLGLQVPGEGVILLPKNTPVPTPTPNAAKSAKPASNFRQWWQFLFG